MTDRLFARHNSVQQTDIHSLQNSAIRSLVSRVDMNSAFLNLAKNDAELIQDIKSAIINMSEEAQKRELLYVSIEHNAKYLCQITKQANQRAE